MKLQILLKEEDGIEGYHHILLQNFQQESLQIPNNGCEEIIANKTINKIPVESIEGYLGLLLSKLRNGGKVSLSGIEPKVMAKKIIDGSFSESEFNQMLMFTNSMIPLADSVKLLQKNGLKINTSSISGIEYDITATRG
jgi:hypothetical protein